MGYDLIIFDLGKVVINFDHNISANKIARRFKLDKNCVYELFFDSKITRLHDEGRLSSKEFYHRIKNLLNINIGYKEFKDCWNNIFFTNAGIINLIRKLKKRYKIYLMSNTNKLHYDFIKNKFDIIKEFDNIALSFRVGVRKPHPKIYRCALRVSKTSPSRAIYIDDRPELVEGARLLGIKGIVFKTVPRLKRELKRILGPGFSVDKKVF